jgi:thiol oxidase
MPSRRSQDFIPTIFFMAFISFLASIVALLFLLPSFGQSKDGNYLYSPLGDDEKASDFAPIIDYLVPDKMPMELSEDYEERKNNPHFLQEDEVNRVVEFYAPWCGHCIHFKPKYIQIARDVNKVAPLVFHAVSCQAHKEICRKQQIQGYPTVKWFAANSSTGEVINGRKISSENILTEYLHVHKTFIDKIRSGASKSFLRHPNASQKGMLNSTLESFHVFHDASLSFYFTMRNNIFMTDGPLSKKQADALHSWLEILSKVLPITMKDVKSDANALLASFNDIIESEANMLKHIMEHNPDHRWTESCSYGKDGSGFTCGLWQLFHIVTVSLVEWNSQAHKEDVISPTTVATAIRDFVEHFFACDECRTNFLEMYDGCKYGLCNHFNTPTSFNGGRETSIWLPIWLWQAHNDVNVRLFREDRESNENFEATSVEERSHLWPSRSDCNVCWMGQSVWNQEEVMNYLHKTYWSAKEYDLQVIPPEKGSIFQKQNALTDAKQSSLILNSSVRASGYMNQSIFVVTTIFFCFSLFVIGRLHNRRRREQKKN